MFCLKHNECEHRRVKCDCRDCWYEESQCEYQYDCGIREGLGLAARRAKRRLSFHSESARDNDFHCSETLCNSAEFKTPERTTTQRTIRGSEEHRFKSTQLSIRSGTPEIVGFHFPVVGSEEWESYIRLLDEYKQSEDKARSIERHIRSIRDQLRTSGNVDTTRYDKGYSDMLRNVDEGSSDHRSDDGSTGYRFTPERTSTAVETRDGLQGYGAHSNRERPSSDAEPRPSRTKQRGPPKKRSIHSERAEEEESTRSSRRGSVERGRRDSNASSDGANRGRFRYYTFIIHKKNQEEGWRAAAWGKAQPQFASFDHGDHYHIIFGNWSESNISRQRNRIGRFLRATGAGITEITLTCTPVRLLRNFVLYCLRYGIKSFNFYGSRIQKEIKDLEDLANNLRDTVEFQENGGECQAYIENRKRGREEDGEDPEKYGRMGKTKRRTIVDVIEQIIEDNNITSFSEWELKVDIPTKNQLLRDFGLQAETYAAKVIKNHKHKETNKYKYRSYDDIIYDEIGGEWVDKLADRAEAIEWIIYLFRSNNLDIIEFYTWLVCIKNMTFIKINGLVLEGHTNAGKSLIIDNTVGPLRPEEIPRERDNNGFHLDQLPFSACALFEEPMITPVNVGTWKLLLEGKQIKTDIKHKDKEGINRLPIFITTATPLTMNVDNKEKDQINQRIKIFEFKATISHREESYTKTCADGGTLRKAPCFIVPYDFIALYLILYKSIQERIVSWKKNLQLNPNKLETTDQGRIQLEILSALYEERWRRERQKRTASTESSGEAKETMETQPEEEVEVEVEKVTEKE